VSATVRARIRDEEAAVDWWVWVIIVVIAVMALVALAAVVQRRRRRGGVIGLGDSARRGDR
jgi:MYXO-CTERM domain-containing protein